MKLQKKNIIYLTGFMGSGKTTVAPVLANVLGYEFIDIDAEIEHLTRKSVTEIFKERGEKHFRKMERSLLLEFGKRHGSVVSLGGGTLTYADNLHIVKSSGLLVYLKAGPEYIFRRMRHKTNRPMLQTADGKQLSDEELRARIALLLGTREPFYNQADVIITTDDKPMRFTIDEIVRNIRKYVE